MKNFTIFGYGYVGAAYSSYLHDYGYDISINDPGKGYKQVLGNFSTDGAIICVNAPTLEDGTVDHGNVLTVIANIRKHNASMPILIKSTILPDIAEEIEETYDNVTYSPEFLTAANARCDVESEEKIILAGQNPQLWADLFADLGKKVHLTDMRTASFMKYAVNTFLATKVTFMNELYDLYGGDWSKLKKLLVTDQRLGTSHFDVPGPDGMRGFGGACFPKDTKAFLAYAEGEMNVLRSAVFTNKKWRSE